LPSRETTAKYSLDALGEHGLDSIFEALLESVEEAYLNSLFMAEDMTGREGHTIKALPVEKLFNLK